MYWGEMREIVKWHGNLGGYEMVQKMQGTGDGPRSWKNIRLLMFAPYALTCIWFVHEESDVLSVRSPSHPSLAFSSFSIYLQILSTCFMRHFICPHCCPQLCNFFHILCGKNSNSAVFHLYLACFFDLSTLHLLSVIALWLIPVNSDLQSMC